MPGRLIDPAILFAPIGGAKSLGLAVSGGADSLALMLLAARWRDASWRGFGSILNSMISTSPIGVSSGRGSGARVAAGCVPASPPSAP
jgi:hypothetical protein